MPKDQAPLIVLSIYFKEKGYRKKNNIWYKKSGEDLILFEYQKSRFQEAFFLNLGIFYKNLNKSLNTPPPSHEWHLIGRHNDICVDYSESIIPINKESKKNEEALDKLLFSIEKKVLPFLDQCGNYTFLESSLESDFMLNVQNLTTDELLEYLRNN